MGGGTGLKIFISSAGRRGQLIQCFRQDARELGLGLSVLAGDLNPGMSSACQMADRCFALPSCADPEYIPSLLEICSQEQIQLLVPTIDPELQVLAEHQQAFRHVGTRVVVSSPEVVRLARNKVATASFLTTHGVPVPRTAWLADLLVAPDLWRWPVILKPADGSGSLGVVRARSLDEARSVAARQDNCAAQEFWEGREYTVNVFFDRQGGLKSAVPHWRCEIRAGEVSKGITARPLVLMDIAQRIGKALPGAYGPLCFQAVINESGEARVFEINARFGGGYPLAHHAGAKFSKWLLEEAARLPSSANDDWEEGVVMLRYDEAVFLKRKGNNNGSNGEDGGRKTEDGRRRTEGGGRRTEDGGRRTKDGGLKAEDGGQKDGGEQRGR